MVWSHDYFLKRRQPRQTMVGVARKGSVEATNHVCTCLTVGAFHLAQPDSDVIAMSLGQDDWRRTEERTPVELQATDSALDRWRHV